MSVEFVLTRVGPNGSQPTGRRYPLNGAQLRLGRGPQCEICIDDDPGVSREHALVSLGAERAWYVSDMNSTNGTFVNGRQILGITNLRDGDRIRLGPDGPTFAFGRVPEVAARGSGAPGGATARGSIRLSDVLPFLSADRTLTTKSPYFWGGIVTVLFALALFWMMGAQQHALVLAATGGNSANPLDLDQRNAQLQLSVAYARTFDTLIGIYLCLAVFLAVYVILGRKKPWWVLAGAGAVTAFVIESPIFGILHAIFTFSTGEVDLAHSALSPLLVVRTIISVGLTEELSKALVVFLLVWAGMKATNRLWQRAGVFDAADAIVIATASATAFTMIETLTLYVPQAFCQYAASYCHGGPTMGDFTLIGFAEVNALQLLIPRIIGDISGHIAYSGYFAYMIGLGLQHRSQFWRLALGGWIGAATMHGLWDACSTLPGNAGDFVQALIGVGSFVVFIAALRRARRVSGLSQPRLAGP